MRLSRRIQQFGHLAFLVIAPLASSLATEAIEWTLVTEKQIAAVEIGEPLAISKIGTTPISPLSKRYKVIGFPEWMTAAVHTPDGARWSFTVSTNEERPVPFKHPRTKSGTSNVLQVQK